MQEYKAKFDCMNCSARIELTSKNLNVLVKVMDQTHRDQTDCSQMCGDITITNGKGLVIAVVHRDKAHWN